MRASGQLYAPVALASLKRSGNNLTGGLVGSNAVLKVLQNTKT
jgi:hypothetical protein